MTLLTRVRIGHHLEFEMQIPLWGDCEILESAIPRLRPAESRTNAARDMTRPLNLVRIYAYMGIALSVLA